MLIPTLLALAALITALANRRLPKNDSKRTETEAFSAQLLGVRELADASKDLVGISQDLINTVKLELTEVTRQNQELGVQLMHLQAESDSLKNSIAILTYENNRMISISKQLINGIGILMVQLKAMDISPHWVPGKELIDTLDRRKSE
jgi:hypothetical protein